MDGHWGHLGELHGSARKQDPREGQTDSYAAASELHPPALCSAPGVALPGTKWRHDLWRPLPTIHCHSHPKQGFTLDEAGAHRLWGAWPWPLRSRMWKCTGAQPNQLLGHSDPLAFSAKIIRSDFTTNEGSPSPQRQLVLQPFMRLIILPLSHPF